MSFLTKFPTSAKCIIILICLVIIGSFLYVCIKPIPDRLHELDKEKKEEKICEDDKVKRVCTCSKKAFGPCSDRSGCPTYPQCIEYTDEKEIICPNCWEAESKAGYIVAIIILVIIMLICLVIILYLLFSLIIAYCSTNNPERNTQPSHDVGRVEFSSNTGVCLSQIV